MEAVRRAAPRQPVRAAGALVERDPVVLEDEVRDEVREHEPRDDEDRVGHAALPAPAWRRARGARRPRRTPSRNSVASARASRPRWRTRPRSAMTETVARLTLEPLGRLGAPEVVDEDQPPDLALARRELVEQRGQERPEVAEQRVRVRRRRSGRPCPRAASGHAPRPRGRRGRPGPLRSVAGPVPGSTTPATIAQRSSRASGWRPARTTARNGSAPGASSSWSSSPWVNPADASRSGAVAAVELVAQRAQERGRTGVASGVDDVAEQHDRGLERSPAGAYRRLG